jgi:hypothetical protein
MPSEQPPDEPSRHLETSGGKAQVELPPPNRLMHVIRFLAGHTDSVIFSEHAQERMEERGFSSEDVYRGLRTGELSGRITRGENAGECRCKVVAQLRGSRKMGIVTIVVMNEYIFVKTVEWEDR